MPRSDWRVTFDLKNPLMHVFTLSPSSPGGPWGPAEPGSPVGPWMPSRPAGPMGPFSPWAFVTFVRKWHRLSYEKGSLIRRAGNTHRASLFTSGAWWSLGAVASCQTNGTAGACCTSLSRRTLSPNRRHSLGHHVAADRKHQQKSGNVAGNACTRTLHSANWHIYRRWQLNESLQPAFGAKINII